MGIGRVLYIGREAAVPAWVPPSRMVKFSDSQDGGAWKSGVARWMRKWSEWTGDIMFRLDGVVGWNELTVDTEG